MKNYDHKILAEFLMSKTYQDVPYIYKKAFILGNIEPDKNPFTYLHGLHRGKLFRGHNYENILPIMRTLFCSVQAKEYWGIREYYHLGKLTHYIADAFTFPHNKTFKGNLREHCSYERTLHQKFCQLPQNTANTENPQKNILSVKSIADIEILHEEYLQKAGDYETDYSYILPASIMLLQSILSNVRHIDWALALQIPLLSKRLFRFCLILIPVFLFNLNL